MSEIPTPLKAIRAKCLDCSCSSQKEVKECVITECSLYPYRMGRYPTSKRKGNPEVLRKWREEQARKKQGEANNGG